MADLLAVEKAFWEERREDLAREHPGKFLLIKGAKVHGVFDSHDAGVTAGVAKFGRGPFWVCNVDNPDPDTLVIPALAAGVPLVAHL